MVVLVSESGSDPCGPKEWANLVVFLGSAFDAVDPSTQGPLMHVPEVRYDETGKPGTWRWPPRA